MERIKEEEEGTFHRGTKTSEVQTSLDLSSAQGCERRNCEIFWKWCQSFHNERLCVSMTILSFIIFERRRGGLRHQTLDWRRKSTLLGK